MTTHHLTNQPHIPYLDPAEQSRQVYAGLADWMDANGATSRDVANRLGLTVQAVNAWRRNGSVPAVRWEMVSALVRTEFVPDPETEPVRRGPAVRYCLCGQPAARMLVFNLYPMTHTGGVETVARLDLCPGCWELEQEQAAMA